MTSEIRANTIKNRVGLGTVTHVDTGIIVSGIVTANSFSGPISGTTGTFSDALTISSTTDQMLNLNSSDNNGTSLAFQRNTSRQGYIGYGGASSGLIIANEVNDGAVAIQGKDGGSVINMLSFASNNKGLATLHGGAIIPLDLDVDGHTNLDNVSIAGVTTITGSGNALEIVGGLVRSRNTASARFVANNGSAEGYFGWSSGVLTVGQAAATLSLEATGSNHIQFKTNGNERLRITSGGDLLLGGHSAYTYDDTGASNVILDIYGGATAGKRGILSLSGRTGNNNADLGTIWFNNDNNSGASPSNNMKLAAVIGAKSVTSDNNAQNDSGAYLQFYTKAESGSVTERLRITSDGKLLVGATSATNGSIAEFSKSVAGGGAGCHITVENTSNNSVNNTAGIQLKTSTGTAKFFKYQAAQTFIQSASGGASELLLQANGAHPMRLYAGDAERVRILNTGDVRFYGNQTGVPNGIFGFRYDKSNDTDLSVENLDNGSVNNNAGIRLATNHGNLKARYFNNGGFYIQNSASGYLHYFTNNVSRFYIDSSGNVNINNQGTIGTSNGGVGKRLGIKSNANNVIIGETESATNFGLILESRVTGRSGNARSSQIGLGNGVIDFYTAATGAGVVKRAEIDSTGRIYSYGTLGSGNLPLGGNPANAAIQIRCNSKYNGIAFGENAVSGAIGLGGADTSTAMVFVANAHPANLGGGVKDIFEWHSGTAGGGGPGKFMTLDTTGALSTVGIVTATVCLGAEGTAFKYDVITQISNIDITNSYATTSTYYKWVLPSAGIYMLQSSMRVRMWGPTGYIQTRLYDNTASSSITNSERMMWEQQTTNYTNVNITLSWVINVSSGRTIYQQFRTSNQTAGNGIQRDGNGHNYMFWQKLS